MALLDDVFEELKDNTDSGNEPDNTESASAESGTEGGPKKPANTYSPEFIKQFGKGNKKD